MSEHAGYFLRMTWPALAGVSLLCLNFFLAQTPEGAAITVPFPGLDVALPLHGAAAHVVVTVLGIGMLGACLLRNYAEAFGTNWQLEVCFDDAGLARCVDALGEKVRSSLRVAPNWSTRRAKMMVTLNERIAQRAPECKYRLDATGFRMAGTGKLAFRIQKLAGQCQTYRVEDCRGAITYSRTMASGVPAVLHTRFDLAQGRETGRLIALSLADLAYRWRKVVSLAFRHTISFADRDIFDAEFVCVTSMRYLPFRLVGHTLHCVEEEGELVPFSYAVNLLE